MPEKPDLSVVIPSYNRLKALQKTLQALEQQDLSPECFEVIIVDDGSTDGTTESASNWNFSFAFRVLSQTNRGAAAARNLGGNNARGRVILFLDSDMIAEPSLLTQHLQSHLEFPHALVAGLRKPYIDSGSDRIVSLMEFGAEGEDPRTSKDPFTFQEAFTCNLSILLSDWKKLGGFDEQFPKSGYEDVEFAYRAEQMGLKIVKNALALAYHNHPMELEQYYQQVRAYHRSAALLLKKHPELRHQIIHLIDKFPVNWNEDSKPLILRKLLRQFLAWMPMLKLLELYAGCVKRLFWLPNLLQDLYMKILSSYCLIGLREGMEQYWG
jgi:glycosyltransferase involved in cell wall biosynthesis